MPVITIQAPLSSNNLRLSRELWGAFPTAASLRRRLRKMRLLA